MRLIFLGAPGAGKGTQAQMVAARLAVPHIASGDMFRHASTTDPQIGAEIKACLDAGNLVPDQLTNRLVAARLRQVDALSGFILDGYPRNPVQAQVLAEILDEQGVKLDKVLKFMITGKEIVRRLSGRRVCPTDGHVYHIEFNPPKVAGICDLDGTPLVQRDDDREEVIQHRLEVYGRQTKGLYDVYGGQGLLADVDAMGTTDEVYHRTLAALGAD